MATPIRNGSGQLVAFQYECWKCKRTWQGCMVEVICPSCEECNYLVDNHNPCTCGGNHSDGRLAEPAAEDIAAYLPLGYVPYRKPPQ